MPLTRNGNTWTEARYRSFIKGALRQASMKWNPIQTARKRANVKRGFYLCSSCSKVVPSTLPSPPGLTKKGKKKPRVKNVIVDHIIPIVDPAVGLVSWDSVIAAMFCELGNLKVLCKACHDEKSTEERDIATERRAKEKANANLSN